MNTLEKKINKSIFHGRTITKRMHPLARQILNCMKKTPIAHRQ